VKKRKSSSIIITSSLSKKKKRSKSNKRKKSENLKLEPSNHKNYFNPHFPQTSKTISLLSNGGERSENNRISGRGCKYMKT